MEKRWLQLNTMLSIIVGLCFMMVSIQQLEAQDLQLIKGVIVDTATLQPIPYVHLQIKSTHQGTVANQDGAFVLGFREDLLHDTLSLSSIGYESLHLPLKQVISKDTLYLKEATIALNPVLITSLTAEEIVRKSIQSIPQNYAQSESYYKGFYRTATKECDTFVRLLEGPVRMVDPGYGRKEEVNITYSAVKQSRDFRNYKLEDKYLLHDALTFEHVRLRNGFLNPSTLDSWKYKLVDYTKFADKTVMVILAEYISDKNKMDHTARLYIDDTDYAIYKIEYEYKWYENYFNGSEIDSLSEAEHHWEGEFHYASEEDQLHIKYFFFHHTKSIFDDFYKRKICDIEVYSEFNAYEVSSVYGEGTANIPQRDSDLRFTKPVETALYQNIMQDLDSLSHRYHEP